MEYQEIFDKLCLLGRNGIFNETINVEQYGSGNTGDALLLKQDVYGTFLREIIAEFDHVFVDGSKGLVVF